MTGIYLLIIFILIIFLWLRGRRQKQKLSVLESKVAALEMVFKKMNESGLIPESIKRQEKPVEASDAEAGKDISNKDKIKLPELEIPEFSA